MPGAQVTSDTRGTAQLDAGHLLSLSKVGQRPARDLLAPSRTCVRPRYPGYGTEPQPVELPNRRAPPDVYCPSDGCRRHPRDASHRPGSGVRRPGNGGSVGARRGGAGRGPARLWRPGPPSPAGRVSHGAGRAGHPRRRRRRGPGRLRRRLAKVERLPRRLHLPDLAADDRLAQGARPAPHAAALAPAEGGRPGDEATPRRWTRSKPATPGPRADGAGQRSRRAACDEEIRPSVRNCGTRCSSPRPASIRTKKSRRCSAFRWAPSSGESPKRGASSGAGSMTDDLIDLVARDRHGDAGARPGRRSACAHCGHAATALRRGQGRRCGSGASPRSPWSR